jgi:hypothetical protein
MAMAQATGPLCPGLYELLRREFGEVTIANEGEEVVVASKRWNSTDKRIEWDIVQPGEYYRVNCPYCGDSRMRLWFHYCYGQRDDDGRTSNWLVNCYNEGCLSGRDRRAVENRQDLEVRLFNAEMSAGERNLLLATKPGRKGDDGPLTEVALPGRVTTLDQLPYDHEAVRYIEDRGYDAAKLGRKYGLCYCHRAFEFSQVQGRIIIPVEMEGQLVGWQARYVGELNWVASGVRKYYNLPGMKKRKMLYNWDRAASSRVVVVVEGVTGVWTVGDPGTALLGKSITAHQMTKLAGLTMLDDRPRCLVLMLDPDADQDHKDRRRLDLAFSSLMITYAKTGGTAIRVHLPKGKDPGNFDHETIWDMIYTAGDAMGVDIAGFA